MMSWRQTRRLLPDDELTLVLLSNDESTDVIGVALDSLATVSGQ